MHIFICAFPLFSDYNAPLTENGAYTEKYNRAAEMISVYDTLSSLLGTSINDVGKVLSLLEACFDLISPPSPSMKIQIVGGKLLKILGSNPHSQR